MTNYVYWQNNGHLWAGEYERRRGEQFYYVAQELLIHHIVETNSIRSVLDFGCGVGRNLKHLLDIKGLQLFGFDQSPTMLNGTYSWADEEWASSHIFLGNPTGPIPLIDKTVEASFTCEVLIHVCPEDVSPILRELIRVTSGFVFHLEPHADYELEAEAHEGCWYHDLVAAYKSLGVEAVRVGRPCYSQELVIAPVDSSAKVPSSFVKLLRDADDALRPALVRGFAGAHDHDKRDWSSRS
jgi:SAM-dependent methyltransferase